jgi:hypothetical protein
MIHIDFCRMNGNIYLLSGNNRIQKWSTGGTIWTTVAGGNGLGIKANQQSTGSFVDTYGNIFVADYSNHRIQKNMPQIIIKAGETGSTYN